MATSDGAVQMLLLGAGHYSAPPRFSPGDRRLPSMEYCPWVVGSLALHVRNCGADRDEIIPHVVSKKYESDENKFFCVCVCVGGSCVHPGY